MVEQALVDMADLLNVEGTERQAAWLRRPSRHLHLEYLQRFQQVQHGAVINRQWLGLRRLPARVGRPPFQERKASGSNNRPP